MFHNGHLVVAGQVKSLKVEQLAVDPGSPALSQVWMNTTTGELKYYDGTAIQVLSTGSGSLSNFLKLDGTSPMTGALTLNSNDQSAASATTAVSKGYLDTVAGTKQNTITGAATTIVSADLTASRVVVSNAGGKIEVSTATAAEVAYLSGVTSSIQAQINSKQGDLGYTPLNKAGDSMSGTLAMNNNEITGVAAPTAPNSAARLIDVQNAVAGMDFQADVVGYESEFIGVPGRYVYIDGSEFTTGVAASAGDIVVVDAAGEVLSVSYDVSTAGNGALAWNETSNVWLSYVDGAWGEFGGLAGVTAGVGLSKSGNVINVNLGAGIAELPTDEVGIDVLATGGLFTTIDGTTSSTASAAQLSVKLNGASLALSAGGIAIAANGVTEQHLNASVVGNGIQGAAGTALSVKATTDGGIVVDASGVAVDDVEMRTRVLYRDGAEAMTGPLTLNSADQSAASATTAISKGYAETLVAGSTTSITNLTNRLVAGYHLFEEVTTAATSYVITHNIGTKYVQVIVYDENDEVIIPDTITATTVNSVTVTFAFAQLCRIVVTGLKAA
jgi:hypothetical protein